MNLGQKLKQLREENNLTLRKVEHDTSISNAYLSQLENGKIKNPSAQVLYKLSIIYHVEISVLLAASGLIDANDLPRHKVLINSSLLDENLTAAEEDILLRILKNMRSYGTTII